MVINNAGVVSGKSLLDCSDASIQRTFDVNVVAHFWVRRQFLSVDFDVGREFFVDHQSIFTLDA